MNDALRHAERRRVFNVDGLCRLAAQSADRSSDDVVDLEKLAEGGFNRTFLITMRGGFQMVARIPYPATIPNYFAVASEVVTMALLRSSGLPIPQIYGYSPAPNNAAETACLEPGSLVTPVRKQDCSAPLPPTCPPLSCQGRRRTQTRA